MTFVCRNSTTDGVVSGLFPSSAYYGRGPCRFDRKCGVVCRGVVVGVRSRGWTEVLRVFVCRWRVLPLVLMPIHPRRPMDRGAAVAKSRAAQMKAKLHPQTFMVINGNEMARQFARNTGKERKWSKGLGAYQRPVVPGRTSGQLPFSRRGQGSADPRLPETNSDLEEENIPAKFHGNSSFSSNQSTDEESKEEKWDSDDTAATDVSQTSVNSGASNPLSPMAALLSISRTLPVYERQVLKEMLIDERLGKGRSIYEFKDEEKSGMDPVGFGLFAPRPPAQGAGWPGIAPWQSRPPPAHQHADTFTTSAGASPLGFTLCEALRTFSATGNKERFKNQLYMLAVQRGMDVGSACWVNVFAPFSNPYCASVSLNARKERIEVGKALHSVGDAELAYGSSNFFAFSSLLERCNIQAGDRFLDLGSGCGRAVLAAAILHGHKLSNCHGIELLESLHNLAVGCERRFSILRSSEPHSRYDFGRCEIGFSVGDIRSAPWPTSPTIVFVGSAVLSPATLDQVEARCVERLPLHGRVVSMSRQLFRQKPSRAKQFEITATLMVRMSWGHCRCYVYKRTMVSL